VKPSLIRRKTYPLDQSPLFKLKGEGQLAAVLRLPFEKLAGLGAASDYRVWDEDGRPIQVPRGRLGEVHGRLASLLKRIALPDYVYSKKGRSHIDNAAQHLGRGRLVKTDIRKFFPNTTREMILRLFVEDFECAEDLSHLLADLCCFDKRHLPTGSPISGYLAFLASKPAFDRIHFLAAERNCVMTAFVDDIAASGVQADANLLTAIRRELLRSGLKTAGRKSRAYGSNSPKKLTGAVLTPDGLRVPNKLHRSVKMTRAQLAQCTNAEERAKLSLRLRGQLAAMDQIRRHPSQARQVPRHAGGSD
jgi:hypothetical protein